MPGKAVWAIVGGDSYRAEAALTELLASVGATTRPELVRGDESTWTKVVDECRTGSLFADHRAVVVRGAEALKGREDAFTDYLADPNPDVALILLASKPDKRRTVWKKILEQAKVVSAEPLKGRALRSFVQEAVGKRNLRLSDEGLEELLERVGADLRRLMGEIDKLEAFALSKGGPLDADDVSGLLSRGSAPPLYKLSDEFSARKLPESLETLGRLLEEGEPPLRILATLHHALRKIRGAKALLEARAPREAYASKLQMPPFKVGDVMEAARAWSNPQLKEGLLALYRADRRIKSSVDGRVALTAVVVESLGARGAKGAPR